MGIAACLDFPLCHPCNSSVCPVQLFPLALGRLVWKESGELHPLSHTQEMEDGLQDTTEERAGKGFLEESFDGPFGLLSCVVDPPQLADLLG